MEWSAWVTSLAATSTALPSAPMRTVRSSWVVGHMPRASRPFAGRMASWQVLGTFLAAFSTAPLGVSRPMGPSVVGSGNTAAGCDAFIWDQVNGIRSLSDLLVNDLGLNLTGWTSMDARAISPDGLTIVGVGHNAISGSQEGWVAHIPEPGTLALLLVGGIAVPGRPARRERRR